MNLFISLLFTLIMVISTASVRSDIEGIDNERDLAEMTCPYGGGVVFFNIQTEVVPGKGATQCSQASLTSIGQMINATFVSVGISAMPGSTFVAGVCTTPTLFTTRALGNVIRRKLLTGFVWKGGGACKGCNPDNRDGRKLLLSTLLKSAKLLFENIFLSATSTIEAEVDAQVTTGLVNYPCMGTNPQVKVDIDKVKAWQVQVDCAFSSLGVSLPWI